MTNIYHPFFTSVAEQLKALASNIDLMNDVKFGRITPRLGVCSLLDARLLNEATFKSWGEFSGDTTYPVHCVKLGARRAYREAVYNSTLWSKDNSYGEARYRLLDHMLSCYEAEVDRLKPLLKAEVEANKQQL